MVVFLQTDFLLTSFFDCLDMEEPAIDHSGDVKDKICLNHFVTTPGYKLKPPYNEYAKDLYPRLVPVMGDDDLIQYFFDSNDWMKKRGDLVDERFMGDMGSGFKRFMEFILGSFLGDMLESFMAKWQIERATRGLPTIMPEGARFICNDEEIEFHTEANEVLKKWKSRENS